jgi:hypothetical protein
VSDFAVSELEPEVEDDVFEASVGADGFDEVGVQPHVDLSLLDRLVATELRFVAFELSDGTLGVVRGLEAVELLLEVVGSVLFPIEIGESFLGECVEVCQPGGGGVLEFVVGILSRLVEVLLDLQVATRVGGDLFPVRFDGANGTGEGHEQEAEDELQDDEHFADEGHGLSPSRQHLTGLGRLVTALEFVVVS